MGTAKDQRKPLSDLAMSKKKAALIHHIILNKVLRIALMLFIAVVIPVLVYLIMFARAIGPLEPFPAQTATCSHLSSLRIRCGENLTENLCIHRGCCYSDRIGCFHYMPSKHQFIHDNESTPVQTPGGHDAKQSGQKFVYSLVPMSPVSAHGFAMNGHLSCEINESHRHLHIMVRSRESTATKVGERNVFHYTQQPMLINKSQFQEDTVQNPPENKEYYYKVSSPIFSISVYRKVDNKLILATQRGPFVVTLNYIEWSFYLGTEILIGLGSMRLTPGFRTIISTAGHTNLPFILAYDADTQKFHGIYLSSLYPIELELTDSYSCILRGIYDNRDFGVHLIMGDDMDTVQSELLDLIGYQRAVGTNILQFGFHICDSEATFAGDYFRIAEDLEQYLDADIIKTIPYDSHCLTERAAALNRQLPEEYLPFFAKFKALGKSVILNVVVRLRCQAEDNVTSTGDCEIEEQYRDAVLTTNSDNTPYRTRIEGHDYLYLDWTSKSISLLLTDHLLNTTLTSLNLGFDGLVLQGNWLQDDMRDAAKNPNRDVRFPYLSADFLRLTEESLVSPWTRTASGEEILRMYNFHGSQSVRLVSENIQTHPQQHGRLFLSSESSTNPNSNTLLRGINATWEALLDIKTEILSNSLTGIHSVNSNICGDLHIDLPIEELCLRWYQYASLTSIYRALTTASPIRFSKFIQRQITKTTRMRYALSSYFQTMRLRRPNRAINVPLFYDYPESYHHTDIISEWIAVGDCLLAAPIITPSQQDLNVLLPDLAFEIKDGLRISKNSSVIMSIVRSDLPIFIKGGHIVPLLHMVNASISSIKDARSNHMLHVVIALQPPTNKNSTSRSTEEGNAEIFLPSARGWLAINEDSLIELNAIQNGSLVTVVSRRAGKCVGTSEMPTSVVAINWFGVQLDDSRPEDNAADAYGSILCSSILDYPHKDLCTEDLFVSVDVSLNPSTDNPFNCELIRY